MIAAIGLGVLGAFVIVERRHDLAILRLIGANTRQTVTAPAIEGGLTAIGSLVIGIPIGIGLAALSVRILGLFFTLPAPSLTVPVTNLIVLALLVLGASAVAIGLTLRKAAGVSVSAQLREP
jgi:putative ABC transport system permease protein